MASLKCMKGSSNISSKFMNKIFSYKSKIFFLKKMFEADNMALKASTNFLGQFNVLKF